MTLNGVMAVILRYFSEFAYLPGVLRKSSRSLPHLLMSSCPILAASLVARHSSSGVSQTMRRGRRNGITELSQTAPPIFCWAAITLGIGPHSSLCIFFLFLVCVNYYVFFLSRAAVSASKPCCPAATYYFSERLRSLMSPVRLSSVVCLSSSARARYSGG